MRKPGIEIMAPVGSYESLSAAINAGCNSVYFGIEQLNMRARSSINFTLDDLANIAEICTKNNVKTYITLNTIMYDHDIRLMQNILDKAKESGISAVIATDLAVMNYTRKIGMPLHVSTQSNITNIETVEFFSSFADVMVLSRELSLKQVADITKEIERREITGPSGKLVRIEVFAHGALCMAVSGKCYLSLHSNNSSANRGACVQNCRRSYTVTDEDGNELKVDNEYIMSAKDLCTISFIDKVIEAGVEVLKIEGRGRSADYVDTTVRCYREAANAVLNGTYTPDKIESWMKELESVYNRGFWDGYYLGRKMGEWSEVYGSKATKKKILLGKGLRYFSNIKVGEFVLESGSLEKGDEILITGPTTGVIKGTVEEMRIDDGAVDKVEKGIYFSMPIAKKVRPSDKLYKVVDA